jgi:hypothetical protein
LICNIFMMNYGAPRRLRFLWYVPVPGAIFI